MPHDYVLSLNMPDDFTKWVALSGGILLVLYTVFRNSKKRRDPLEHQPVKSALSQQRAVEQQMSNLLVELSEMARQITSQLDTRAAKLEALMRDADQRIAALKVQQNGNGSAGHSSTPVTSAPSDSPAGYAAQQSRISPPPQEVDTRHAEVYALADQGLSAADIARKLSRPNGEIELILALRAQ